MKALDRGQTPTITPDLTDELFVVQVDADGVARDGRASIGTLLEATASSQYQPIASTPQRTVAAMSSTTSNYVSMPDLAALSGATQLDIRWIELGNSGSSGVIVAQASSGSTGLAFGIIGSPGDDVRLFTSNDGTTSTLTASTGTGAVRPAAGALGAVRVTWRSSDGRMQSFSKATSDISEMLDNAGWTQTGSDGLAGTTALFNSSAVVSINTYADGASPGNVQVMALSIATTIDGTPAALFRADTPAAPRYIDAYANTWTYTGSAYAFRTATT